MVYDGYLSLAGTEVVNTARASVYAAALGVTTLRCTTCPTLPAAVGDAPYTIPAADPAPWWDPAVPESGRFAGLVGLEVDGADGTGARTPTDLLGDGAAIGPLRRGRRELTWRVGLLAADDCGLSYGLGWLASVLRGAACGTGCGGDTACVLACCPTCPPDTQNCGDGQQRELFGTGLLDGPTLKSLYELGGTGAACGASGGTASGARAAEVEFSLVAGNPFWYRQPVPIVNGDTPAGSRITVATGVVRLDPAAEDCPEPPDCIADPSCTPPPAPPVPPIPTDPCYPTGAFPARRTVVTVPAGTLPAWSELVPVVTVHTGRSLMRRLTVRLYSNPLNIACDPDALDPCLACEEINVPYLPAGVQFTLDGRVRRAWVDCLDATGSFAEPTLYGPGGGLFTWPVIGCGGAVGLCVEVSSDDRYTAYDARISVAMAARDDAA